MSRTLKLRLLGAMLLGTAGLTLATWMSMRDFPDDSGPLTGVSVKYQVLARDGTPLSYTLANDWNTTAVVQLTSVPALLQTALIVSEDLLFYVLSVVDWLSRFAALALDFRSGSAVRGASSITEQVVRMILPRPR